jgi:hypothetical protein
MINHNLARVTDDEAETMEKLAEEEDMYLENQEELNFVLASQLEWDGVEEELRIIRKVLNEVYRIDINDIERTEEHREGDTISWSEV